MCYVLCAMCYVLYVMCYVLCAMCYVLCAMCYVRLAKSTLLVNVRKIRNITQLLMQFSPHSDEVERQWHFQQLLIFDKNCQTYRLGAIRL